MENFRCLTKDSNNKAVYGPWHRGNVAEMGVNKCLVRLDGVLVRPSFC